MPDNIRKTLAGSGLAPSKKLGQNFLVHRQTAERIVTLADAGPDDTVVEIGVGLGALTQPLACRVAQVIGLEFDAGIVAWHEENQDLPANVSLRHQDVLAADFAELAQICGGRLKIIANLPYSISNPLLFRLVEHADRMDWAVLMLQKEVAERLAAPPGTKEYGVLSVLLAGCATVETLMNVGPGQFHPRPKVDSRVVRITFQPVPGLSGCPTDEIKRLVNAAFQKRRKTIANALSPAPHFAGDKQRVLALLAAAGIAPERRPETLTVHEYASLVRLLGR